MPLTVRLPDIKNLFMQRDITILGSQDLLKSAVMLPLVLEDEEVHILFQVRSKELNSQPGEICFPGGRIDRADINEEAAAKRELCEELGLSPVTVETLAPLDYLVTPFRGIIYPFIGVIHQPEQMQLNKAEVEDVFTVPLSYLLQKEPECYHMELHIVPDANFPFHLIPNQEKYQQRISKTPQYFFYYKDYVIWGLTALILQHFLTLVKKELT